jgi:hypothetical protein
MRVSQTSYIEILICIMHYQWILGDNCKKLGVSAMARNEELMDGKKKAAAQQALIDAFALQSPGVKRDMVQALIARTFPGLQVEVLKPKPDQQVLKSRRAKNAAILRDSLASVLPGVMGGSEAVDEAEAVEDPLAELIFKLLIDGTIDQDKAEHLVLTLVQQYEEEKFPLNKKIVQAQCTLIHALVVKNFFRVVDQMFVLSATQLAEYQIDVTLADKGGDTALDLIVGDEGGEVNWFQLSKFIERGYNFLSKDKKHDIPFVKLLDRKDIQANFQDLIHVLDRLFMKAVGRYAEPSIAVYKRLMFDAVQVESLPLLLFLLDMKEVNQNIWDAESLNSFTPLMLAVRLYEREGQKHGVSKLADIILELVKTERKPDLTTKNKLGLTLVQYVNSFKSRKLFDLLSGRLEGLEEPPKAEVQARAVSVPANGQLEARALPLNLKILSYLRDVGKSSQQQAQSQLFAVLDEVTDEAMLGDAVVLALMAVLNNALEKLTHKVYTRTIDVLCKKEVNPAALKALVDKLCEIYRSKPKHRKLMLPILIGLVKRAGLLVKNHVVQVFRLRDIQLFQEFVSHPEIDLSTIVIGELSLPAYAVVHYDDYAEMFRYMANHVKVVSLYKSANNDTPVHTIVRQLNLDALKTLRKRDSAGFKRALVEVNNDGKRVLDIVTEMPDIIRSRSSRDNVAQALTDFESLIDMAVFIQQDFDINPLLNLMYVYYQTVSSDPQKQSFVRFLIELRLKYKQLNVFTRLLALSPPNDQVMLLVAAGIMPNQEESGCFVELVRAVVQTIQIPSEGKRKKKTAGLADKHERWFTYLQRVKEHLKLDLENGHAEVRELIRSLNKQILIEKLYPPAPIEPSKLVIAAEKKAAPKDSKKEEVGDAVASAQEVAETGKEAVVPTRVSQRSEEDVELVRRREETAKELVRKSVTATVELKKPPVKMAAANGVGVSHRTSREAPVRKEIEPEVELFTRVSAKRRDRKSSGDSKDHAENHDTGRRFQRTARHTREVHPSRRRGQRGGSQDTHREHAHRNPRASGRSPKLEASHHAHTVATAPAHSKPKSPDVEDQPSHLVTGSAQDVKVAELPRSQRLASSPESVRASAIQAEDDLLQVDLQAVDPENGIRVSSATTSSAETLSTVTTPEALSQSDDGKDAVVADMQPEGVLQAKVASKKVEFVFMTESILDEPAEAPEDDAAEAPDDDAAEVGTHNGVTEDGDRSVKPKLSITAPVFEFQPGAHSVEHPMLLVNLLGDGKDYSLKRSDFEMDFPGAGYIDAANMAFSGLYGAKASLFCRGHYFPITLSGYPAYIYIDQSIDQRLEFRLLDMNFRLLQQPMTISHYPNRKLHGSDKAILVVFCILDQYFGLPSNPASWEYTDQPIQAPQMARAPSAMSVFGMPPPRGMGRMHPPISVMSQHSGPGFFNVAQPIDSRPRFPVQGLGHT